MSSPLRATHYDVLGITVKASPAQIRQAWLALARQLHPDHGDDYDPSDFIRLREAYEVLSDPTQRRRYDADLAKGSVKRSVPAYPQGPASEPPAYTRPRSDQPPGPRGHHIRASVSIDFVDAIFGVTTEVYGTRKDVCHSCTGYPPPPRCVICGLTGYEPTSFTTALLIPPGTVAGADLVVANLGDVGERPVDTNGPYGVPGPPGDLLVRVDVRPQPGVVAQGMDLLYDLPVDVIDALLGERATMELIDGPATVIIPPGTPPGQRLRLPGRGVPQAQGLRGDALAEVRLIMRDSLTQEERSALESVRLGPKRLPDSV
jgi:molecular chaperone DnaJ